MGRGVVVVGTEDPVLVGDDANTEDNEDTERGASSVTNPCGRVFQPSVAR